MSSSQVAVMPPASSRVAAFFTSPIRSKLEGADSRNSVLLAWITLVFTIGILIRLFFFSFQVVILIGAVVSVGAYLLSRTRYYKVAGVLVLIAGVAPSLVNVIVPEQGVEITRDWLTSRLFWMALVLVLASTFLSIREVAVFFILTFASLAILPLITNQIDFEMITGTLGFFAVFDLLILAAMNHRSQIEADRQRELTTANARLRESEITLEQRVQDRTRELSIAKDEAEEARHRAEQADQVKSQFLASMSHELRTPLNAILNFVDMTLMGIFGPINAEQADAMQKSLDSGKHLLSLINDVLDITKIHSGMMKLFYEDDVQLDEEVKAVIAAAEPLMINKPLKLIVEVDSDLPILRADRRRIKQVLLNLVSNAVKFTEEGSITLKAHKKEGQILFSVIDTGPGIAEADQTIIFEPFQQTETGVRHAGGTGLGLPISKYLIEAHSGRLWVESTLGKGAAFHATLPIVTAAAG